MPTFDYQARSKDGQLTAGILFSPSMDSAIKELSGKGLEILKIGIAVNPNDPLAAMPITPIPTSSPTASTAQTPSERAEAAKVYNALAPEPGRMSAPSTEQRSYMETSVWGPLVGKVPLKDLGFFFRQLSTMLDAGVPVVQSINTLANQANNATLKEILNEMVGHVNAGNSLSDCMQRYPEVFSAVMLSLVRVGELGGFVDEALGMVADYIDREIELRNLYKRVTFMPKLQIGASIVIILVTNWIIASMGKKGGLWSPLTEPATWVILGPLIIGAFLFFRVGLANPRVRYNFDQFMARIPYIGTTFRQLAMAKFGRAFGALHKGGVPLFKSMLLSADACGNEFLRARMYTAQGKMEEGSGVTETFRDTQAFSPIVLDMVATGETTGNLDHMLTKMSEFYEDEAATRSAQTAQVVGVVLFLLVAIYIGYVVISFYTGNAASSFSGGG